MQQKMDTRFGTRDVRSPNRAGSLKTVMSDLAMYKLDVLAVQGVRWD
jgi:hypothetical protein